MALKLRELMFIYVSDGYIRAVWLQINLTKIGLMCDVEIYIKRVLIICQVIF